jgi:hypothetical protein
VPDVLAPLFSPFPKNMKIKAVIQNPTEGAATHTGQNRARRLVKSGRARLVQQCPETGAILVIALAGYVADLEQRRLEQEERLKFFARTRQDKSYDEIGRLMRPKEVKKIGFVGDIMMMYHGQIDSNLAMRGRRGNFPLATSPA